VIRRSPAELYIKYLVLHPKQYKNPDIKGILEFAHLDFLGDWYVNKLRAELKPPTPFRPLDQNHAPSSAFLYKENLRRIFFPDKHGVRAFELLKNARVKEFVEAMLVVGVQPGAIANKVRKKFNFRIEAADVERYTSFFWDIELLTMTEFRALLHFRNVQMAMHSDPEIRAQAGAVKKASYKDAVATAAEMPSSQLSAVAIMLQLGTMPSKLDLQFALGQTSHVMAVRMVEALSKDGLNDPRKVLDYTSAWKNLVEIGKELIPPDEDLHKRLATISSKSDDADIPTIHELSKGAHTAEVAKMETHDGQPSVPSDLDDGDGGDDDPLSAV
jgi:hypothetical protein